MADDFTWDDRALQIKLEGLDAKVQRGIDAAVAMHAARAVSYARANARWTDRTSNARNGLFARASRSGNTRRITVGHGVPYGIWLEVRFSGRYAIIRPTVDHEGPELMRTVVGLVNGLR